MRYCQYVQDIADFRVYHREGKSSKDEVPYLAFDRSTKLWIIDQQLDDAFQLIAESLPQTWHFRFIVSCSLDEFQLRLRMKFVFHPLIRARSLSNTSGPGTPSIFPSTSSRYRR
jgi:hypothetical protein